jgi:histidyl-tRNA synthetase
VAAVRAHLEPKFETLSDDSKKRFQLNPLRIFDSKDERDREALQGAPHLLDALRDGDTESYEHFQAVCAHLDNLKFPYEIDHHLVGGCDYFSRTAFEFVSDKLGAQSTVLGGGRYDGLVQELGGAPTPGIGFGSGIERLMLVREAMGLETPAPAPPRAFLVLMGDVARANGPQLLQRLRAANISCDCDFVGRSVKAQMREANRQNAPFVLMLGEDELAQNSVTLKNMADSSQQLMPFEDAIQQLQNM